MGEGGCDDDDELGKSFLSDLSFVLRYKITGSIKISFKGSKI